MRIPRDRNLLAYKGKRKELIRVLAMTESGAVAQYETMDKTGDIYMPLIVDGENVEEFEIIGEQITMM